MMSGPTYHYTKADLVGSLRAAGVAEGDVIFVHASLGRLGYSERGRTMQDACSVALEALLEALGSTGTLLVPTYSYSIGKGEVYDPDSTPSTLGDFTEHVRLQPEAIRSADPMLAVSGIGPEAASLLQNLPRTCYGPGSIYDRLHERGGRIVMLGLDLFWATCRHYIEERANVPFRFKKLFTGTVRQQGNETRQTWIYSCAPRLDNCAPNGIALGKLARERGLSSSVKIGRGEVCAIGAREYAQLGLEVFAQDPWNSAKGPPLTTAEIIALEDARTSSQANFISLPDNASMEQMLTTLAPLKRDIVSAGYDSALNSLAGQLPMTLHEFASGTECSTWIVPEKWTCHEAALQTLDGRTLFSTQDHALHVVSYSMPFDGVVSREELLRHLHVHPRLEDAVPFVFKYYQRDWGLCCTQNQRAALTKDEYRVIIRTDTSYSHLKVGEVIVPGQSDASFVLCSHLCHPAQAADDLSGVVVGMEVMRRLRQRKRLRYTYRFLILPETIGSAAWLSRHSHLIPKLHGGLFLEMLSLPHAPALQMPFDEQTPAARVLKAAFEKGSPDGWCGAYRSIIGNDERQFNGPGARVPMLSLSRVLPRAHPEWPYREYHSSEDDVAHASIPHLEASVELVMQMIDAWEANQIPLPRFTGEVFCSRYGIHIDPTAQPELHRHFFSIMDMIDGHHTVSEIAARCQTSLEAVEESLAILRHHDLVC
jgi:aminopeptidase-like protein/aminoglycoside N3'-acetyltransferase